MRSWENLKKSQFDHCCAMGGSARVEAGSRDRGFCSVNVLKFAFSVYSVIYLVRQK